MLVLVKIKDLRYNIGSSCICNSLFMYPYFDIGGEVMRLGKLFLVVFIVFGASFYWANSSVVKFLQPQTGWFEPAGSHAASVTQRILRVVALKTAINAKLNKEEYIKLEAIPLGLRQAVIAVEDSRFYTHPGFDVEAIFRAALVNLQIGTVVEGGSTITQQLVKNLFLSHDRTVSRKLEEFVLAVDLELRYSKGEILEMYLNTIYFGADAYGIGPASRAYFSKEPSQLTLAEATLLAGLPNAPGLYSPYTDLNAAKRRQAVVLASMVRNSYIDTVDAEIVRDTPLHFSKPIPENL